MKFKTLLLTALLTPTAAMAGWELNQHGAALVTDNEGDVFAAVYLSKTFEIVSMDKCDSSYSATSGPIDVNGTYVTFKRYCHTAMGTTATSPKSPEGKAFIFKQFKTKTVVNVGSSSFSAMGFSKAMKAQDIRIEASKNAL